MFLGYINVNSIRNKFDELFRTVGDNFDVISIAETKLDDSFPKAQFQLKGYKMPYRLDITDTSGGLLVYVKNGLPSSRLKGFSLPNDIQIIPIEIRLNNSKWLVISIYRPPKKDLEYLLANLTKILDFYDFDRCLLIGDFNTNPENDSLRLFMESQLLYNHVKFKTCFKANQGSCIDLILSNQKHCLHSTGGVNTGVSDHHHLIYTMLRSTYHRKPPKTVPYRCYRKFVKQNFEYDLANELYDKNLDIGDYNTFEDVFESVLDKHDPMKSKQIRGNEKPHVNKELRKAIMKRSRLWNIFIKSKHSSDLNAYRVQRNLVTKLNKKAKKSFFNRVMKSSKTKPKDFWKVCSPFFSNKNSVENDFVVKHNGEIIHDSDKIAKLFNVHFNGIANSLNLFEWNKTYCSLIDDPVLRAIDKFKNHPSIIKIKNKFGKDIPKFKFKEVNCHQVNKMLMSIDCTKKTGGYLSNSILKSSSNVICAVIRDCINRSFQSCKFPNKLKLAEITPVPKIEDSQDIGDFRPISILPSVSKLFEKAMVNQLGAFTDTRFSKFLCGFRKAHSTQHAMLRLLNKWQNSLDKRKFVGTILTDLSKAYDCLLHDLLIAKLAAYGIEYESLSLLYDYLSNRFHRVKVGASVSDWLELLLGVPQGSILGPLLFNTFINDLFLFVSEADICNFADDNTLFAESPTKDEVIKILQRETINVIEWFKINSMAANPRKFQFMLLGGTDSESYYLNLNGILLESTNSIRLLGLTIDSKLNFNTHVESLCKKASQKVKALFRIRRYLNVAHSKLLCNTYILSTFNYCPLIWMFGSKLGNNKINQVHKRALRAVYQNYNASLEELLRLDQSDSIHIRNLRKLLVEIYKSLNHLNPEFMWDMFKPKSTPYTFRSGESLLLPTCNTVTFGLNSVVFRGSILWCNLENCIKSSSSVANFKTKVKSWSGQNCSCRICS